jgi:hypothetical protein
VLSANDVELMAELESTAAFKKWNARLVNLRVVVAERHGDQCWLFSRVWWHVEVESVDGWTLTTDKVSVIDLVDIEEFVDEVANNGFYAGTLQFDVVRQALSRVLRRALSVAQERLNEVVWNAPYLDDESPK